MFDKLKKFATDARLKVADEVKRFKNREFLDAVTAGCALVAIADGSLDSEEKQKMLGFIQQSPELGVFDTSDVIESFNSITTKLEFDADIGKAEALKTIGRLRNNTDAARLLVRICCAIGKSDGDFDADEIAVCKEICAELNLNPADFKL